MNFKQFLLEKYIQDVKLKREEPIYHNLYINLEGRKARVNAAFFIRYTCFVHDPTGNSYIYTQDTTYDKQDQIEVSFEEYGNEYVDDPNGCSVKTTKNADVYDVRIMKAFYEDTKERINISDSKLRLKIKWLAIAKFNKTRLEKIKSQIKTSNDHRWDGEKWSVKSKLRKERNMWDNGFDSDGNRLEDEEDDIPM